MAATGHVPAGGAGVPARRLGRRVRPHRLQLPRRRRREDRPGRGRHRAGPQPPQRRPAAGPHRPARLRRRHVVRLGQHPHHPGQGPRGRRRGTPSPAPARAAIHDRLKPYDDHVITQVATGLFGVREDTIQRVRIVEFKYAQGAKPGLGGHLLGDKNTPAGGPHARGRGRQRPVLARSPSTASTASRTTRSTSTGSRRSTRGRWSA